MIQVSLDGCDSRPLVAAIARRSAWRRLHSAAIFDRRNPDPMYRRRRCSLAVAALFGLAFAVAQRGHAETVNFGTDWKAEAEHGGFYQAIATGIYQRHGLDVTLRPGGPQVN